MRLQKFFDFIMTLRLACIHELADCATFFDKLRISLNEKINQVIVQRDQGKGTTGRLQQNSAIPSVFEDIADGGIQIFKSR